MDFFYVRIFMDERGSNEINVLFIIKFQVVFVFFRQCWQIDRNVWQVNIFVFIQSVVVQNFIFYFSVSGCQYFYFYKIVVNQNMVVYVQVFCKIRVSDCYVFFVINNFCVSCESEFLVSDQIYIVIVFQFDSMDFWIFSIQQDCQLFTGYFYYFMEVSDMSVVFNVVIVREVEMYNIYVSVYKFSQFFYRFSFWVNCIYDFGFFYGRVFLINKMILKLVVVLKCFWWQ